MSDREDLQLSAIQLEYLEWLCTPKDERSPSSERAWAEANHVDITTPRRWKRQAHFKQEWQARSMQLQGTPERTQALLDQLYEQAFGSHTACSHCGQKAGSTPSSVRAAELWGRWTGQLRNEAARGPEPVSAKELTDAELDDLLKRSAEDELAARRRVQAS